MPHLKLVSVLSGFFSATIVALVSFALQGQLNIGDIVTAIAVGFGSGFGVFLIYRNRPNNRCK